MRKKYLTASLLLVGLGFPKLSFAHCPLCTAGAGLLAVLALSLGVKSLVIASLIGAFSLALAFWIARKVPKNYFAAQFPLLVGALYLLTLIPLAPLLVEYGPFYLNLSGAYGSLWHNTYTVNLYYLGALIGSALVLISPFLSNVVTKLRQGRRLPFQTMGLTLLLLLLSSVIIQLL